MGLWPQRGGSEFVLWLRASFLGLSTPPAWGAIGPRLCEPCVLSMAQPGPAMCPGPQCPEPEPPCGLGARASCWEQADLCQHPRQGPCQVGVGAQGQRSTSVRGKPALQD